MGAPVGLIGDLLHRVAEFAVHVLDTTGYAGLFLLMVAESLVLPVPSEAVMPFAGYLAARGDMGILGAMLASSAGSLVGSWIGYLMGKHGLLPLVRRFGKYVMVHEHHIDAAQGYFARRGTTAVFLCRFIPGVRHISSIPAGAAKMPLLPFAVATVAGATLWNMFLFFVGYRYGQAAAEAVKPYLDVVGIGILVLIVAYVAYEVRKAKKAKASAAAVGPHP